VERAEFIGCKRSNTKTCTVGQRSSTTGKMKEGKGPMGGGTAAWGRPKTGVDIGDAVIVRAKRKRKGGVKA